MWLIRRKLSTTYLLYVYNILIKYMHVQANNNRCGFDNVVFCFETFLLVDQYSEQISIIKLILVYVTT